MSCSIKIISENEITPDLDSSIRSGLCRCFPKEVETFSGTRAWHGSFPSYSVIAEDGAGIAAHVGIIDRIIKAGILYMRIAGIQNVFVMEEYRGSGLGRRIMKAAMKEAGRLRFDAGLLYCIPELVKVYAGSGWNLIPEKKIIRINENGEEVFLPEKNIAMYYPLKSGFFPEGIIHLQGNDW